MNDIHQFGWNEWMWYNVLGWNSFFSNGRAIPVLKYLNLLPYGVFNKVDLSYIYVIMSKVDLKEAKYGPFVHVSHIQDSNGKFYKMK
jgi:hypothetical protein